MEFQFLEITNKIQTKYNSIIENNLTLEDFKDDLFLLNGKKIRSYFHFLLSKILGYEGEEWQDVGSVLEMVHTASLFHDDVLDEANFRRGLLSFNNKWGNKTAILIGDFLLACGLKHLASLKNNKLIISFSKAIQQLSISEILQNKYLKNPEIKLDDYLMIIKGKTGSLFGTASETASILSNDSESSISEFYEIGMKFGLFFQIRDDYLDYFSSYEKSGKSVLKDFQNGLYTYPIFILIEQTTHKETSQVHFLFQKDKKNEQEYQIILDLLDKYQIKKMMKQKLNSLLKELLHSFDNYPESYPKKLIIEQINHLSF